MKKLFWVTTALVTLGGISVAAADVSISGDVRFRYHTWSDDVAGAAGANNSAFADDLQLWVNSDMVADNGLEYGTGTRTVAAGTIDRNYIYLRDDWGQLTLGRNWGPEYSMSLGADWRGTGVGTFNVAGYGGDNEAITGSYTTMSETSGKAVYATPNMSGFKAAVSFADAGKASKADITAVALNYSTSVMGDAAVRLGVMQESKSKSGSDAKEKHDEFGLEVTNGPLLMSAIKMNRKAGNNKKNATEFEIAFDATDDIVLNMIHLNGKVDGGTHSGDKFKSTQLGAAYTVAPGLIVGVAHKRFDATDGNTANADSDGNETRFQVRVNF